MAFDAYTVTGCAIILALLVTAFTIRRSRVLGGFAFTVSIFAGVTSARRSPLIQIDAPGTVASFLQAAGVQMRLAQGGEQTRLATHSAARGGLL